MAGDTRTLDQVRAGEAPWPALGADEAPEHVRRVFHDPRPVADIRADKALAEEYSAARGRTARDAKIRGLLDVWQQRLNLMDWEIRYEPSDIARDKKGLVESMAEVDYRFEEKIAQIRIDNEMPEEGLELCVVHELLHVVFKPMTILSDAMLAQQKEPARGVLANLIEPAEDQIIETLCRAFGLGPRFLAYDHYMMKKYPAFAQWAIER